MCKVCYMDLANFQYLFYRKKLTEFEDEDIRIIKVKTESLYCECEQPLTKFEVDGKEYCGGCNKDIKNN